MENEVIRHNGYSLLTSNPLTFVCVAISIVTNSDSHLALTHHFLTNVLVVPGFRETVRASPPQYAFHWSPQGHFVFVKIQEYPEAIYCPVVKVTAQLAL